MGTVASQLIENDYIRSFIKFILHLFMRKCQIARICLETERGIVAVDSEDEAVVASCAMVAKEKVRPEDSMVWRFAVSLYRSKQLKAEKTLVFGVPFNISHVIKQIFLRKSINEQLYSPILRENLTYCLQLINWVNVVVDHVATLQRLAYSASNIKHVALLEMLWSNMMPDITRRNTESKVNGEDCPLSPIPPHQPLISADWGEVGFQGKDPTTDFRGMGLYGLLQLVYLSNVERGFRARKMLFESRHPRRYFPFAASGINVTAFVLNDLLRGRRLHSLLFQCIHNTLHNSSINISVPASATPSTASNRRSGAGAGVGASPRSYGSQGAIVSLADREAAGFDMGCSSFDADDEQYYQCEGGSPVRRPGSGATRGSSPDLLGGDQEYDQGCGDTDVLLAQFNALEPAILASDPKARTQSPPRSSSGSGTGSSVERDLQLNAQVHTPSVLLQACMNRVNDVYVETYELFFEEWVAADPENIMAFQRIFGLTKQKITAKYKALQ
jgi:hypothetical protein